MEITFNDMNKTLVIILTSFLAVMPMAVSAQTNADPEGYVTYSLPSTTITLDVEAVQERFYAGPYAKFAEKYLGIKPRMKDETTVQLTQLKMTPLVEADQSRHSYLRRTRAAPPASTVTGKLPNNEVSFRQIPKRQFGTEKNVPSYAADVYSDRGQTGQYFRNALNA